VPPGGWDQPIAPAERLPGVPLASWGSRVAATLLDWLILFVPVAIIVAIIVAVALQSDVAGIVVGLVGALAYLLALLLYAPLFMARQGEHNGQSLGKQIVGIRVTRDNGVPFDVGQGILREFVVKGLLFGTVGSFFLYIPTLLDYLWPLWDGENRALHDMVVSTHVVHA
jgi:uncharacterized RDD family membrane protein YckC